MNITDTGQIKLRDISEVGITDGLIGYWKLDGDVKDYSGKGNHGTVNGAIVSGGLKELSYNFNGTSSNIEFTNPINITLPYSITFWAKPNNTLLPGTQGGGDRKTLIVGPGPVWNPGIWVTNQFFRIHCNAEYSDVNISWTDLSWHFIGMIFDGTASYHIWDGNILTGTKTNYSPTTTSTLYLGSETSLGNFTNWDGKISNVKIFDRKLSKEETLIEYKFGLTSSGMQLEKNGTLYLNGNINEGL